MFIQLPVAMIVIQREEVMVKMLKIYKFRWSIFLLFMFAGITLTAQEKELTEGSVSYITGQNVYVRFSNTAGIENGDTLFIKGNGELIPALVVQHQSSTSCLCAGIGEINFKISDVVFAKINPIENPKPEEVQTSGIPEKDVNEQVLINQKNKTENSLQNFVGNLSLSSYSNFSNSGDDSHRFRYTFSSKATNIEGSKFSVESYISFTHKLNQWNLVQENLNNALKIYSLALDYNFNETTSLSIGRKINPRIANVGAIDGFQFEYGFRNMFAGIVAGTRPDYQDYGLNFDLFEYGAYFGQSQKVKNGFVRTSLAFFEQQNKGKTDRRFVYFQHTNSALKNLNFFSSVELDLYRLENNQPKNALSLTSLYLSLNYRISKQLSLFGSYDNRKNVVYFETFRNYADEILQQASRQGIHFRINYRPLNYLMFGINAGTRFRNEDPKPTNTLNGFVNWSKLPYLNAALNVSANLMQTSYLDGQIYGARLSKDIIQGKIYSMINYRWVKFKYLNAVTELRQNIGEVDISYQINKKLVLSVNFEATFQQKEMFNRLYLNLRKKF